ncbi:hypothetical protein [Paratractidigestivibacter sp.]|uniref:hypothetical protein n=1 Tax=Paratractidigestivibacter sp. TaxID=2847316 RepID=UPI002AC9F06B|nr:hypothetical protein [Paratractidigestivibacter sp.]
MRYIVMDPSGSFDEGKGHTGVCILEDDDWEHMRSYSIAAKDFKTRCEYWKAHVNLITTNPDATFVVESFMIRSDGFLVGKMPETIRLIGVMQYFMDCFDIKYAFQTPVMAKARFKDEALPKYIPGLTHDVKKKRYYLYGNVINDHMRDAMKHLLYYKKYTEAKTCKTK